MRKYFIFLILVLSLAALACRLGSTAAQRPASEIPITTEEAQLFEQNLKSAGDSLTKNGEFDLQITESQLTSYVYFQIQEQPQSGITDPQIFLQDGKIQMYATYSESKLPVDIIIIITPQVTDGKITLRLDSVKLGPAAAPQALIEKAQQIITEQIEPDLNQSMAGGLTIDTLSVADGILDLQGKKP